MFGLSAILGGAASAAGSAASAAAGGIGSAIGGIGAGIAAEPLMAAGLGMSALSGLGGGGGSSGPSYAPAPLTYAGRRLEGKVKKHILNDVFPENIAAQYIGKAKRIGQQRQRMAEQVILGASSKQVKSGKDITGLLNEANSSALEKTNAYRDVHKLKMGHRQRQHTNYTNYLKQIAASGFSQAQSAYLKSEADQMAGARQGAAIGNIAQLLAVYSTQKQKGS